MTPDHGHLMSNYKLKKGFLTLVCVMASLTPWMLCRNVEFSLKNGSQKGNYHLYCPSQGIAACDFNTIQFHIFFKNLSYVRLLRTMSQKSPGTEHNACWTKPTCSGILSFFTNNTLTIVLLLLLYLLFLLLLFLLLTSTITTNLLINPATADLFGSFPHSLSTQNWWTWIALAVW